MAAPKSKKLSQSDVTSRLSVPKEWWELIEPLFDGGQRSESTVWAINGATGMFWEFRCAVRRKGPYNKPVFQSENWLKFVNYKGLRAGDKIFLENAEHEFRGTRFILVVRRLVADGQRWVDF